MSEPQLVLAILALVRTAAAVALFDLYRRLRERAIAPLSVGLALYALAPLLDLVLGGSEYGVRSLVLQSAALTLLVCGVIAHFSPISVRITVAATGAVTAIAFIGALLLPRDPMLLNLFFLVGIIGIATLFIVYRKPFRQAAGSSFGWGLVICAVAGLLYAARLFGADGPTALLVEQFLRITVSVALGLYLMNLEFNMGYIKMQRIQDRYRTLFNAAGDSILVSDHEGRILDANLVASRQLGYTVDELVNMRITDIDDAESAALVQERIAAIRREGHAVFESRQKRKDGTVFPVEVNANRFEWDGAVATLGLIRDLSDRKRSEDLILQMAYYDPLTGLANRTLLHDRLEIAVAHAKRTSEGLALFFIDVDNFKTVNDTLGHAMGDRLLVAIAGLLHDLVREGDTVARLGGDEYTLLLPEIASEGAAAAVAWKVLESMQAPFKLDEEHEIHATVSIGIALFNDTDNSPEVLLRNADTAMFRAKDRGRNTYQFYDPAMNASMVERFELKNELRRAVEAGELELQFQPLLSIPDQRIVGAEALLRWDSPTRGSVPPDVFVPLAEESGLIVPLGRWILDRACREARIWHDAGFSEVRVSVNLSARQLVDDDLLSSVSRLLAECGIPPASLELEITESVAMQHGGAVVEALRRLAQTGVRIAIDDFGTGYSSLDRLKRLPISTLKIAQPFVDDLCEADDSSAIAATIVVLGHNLGLNVVAEGVETREQLAFLREHDCQEMQGFLFSPAVSATRFLEMLEESRIQVLEA